MERIREVNKTFLITVAAAVGASFFIGAIPALEENPLFQLLISQLIYAVPVFIYLGKSRGNRLEALRIHGLKTGSILLLVVFSYLITPVLNLLNAVSLLFSTNVINNSLTGIIKEYPLWLSVIAIGMVPGILEECVYRGVFFNEYRKINPRMGILLSGLLFGLMHLNINQFVYAFVMGIIFALLVEATDSLLSSMLVHFCINGTSVVLSRTAPDMAMTYSREELLGSIQTLLLPALVMTVLAFWVLYLIAGIEGRKEAVRALFVRENKKRETVVTLPLLLGMGICAILMIIMELASRFPV